MLINKIKDRGWRWFFYRLLSEIRKPTKPSLIYLMDTLLRCRHVLGFSKVSDDRFLYAIFDLEIAPVTYNIVEFLIDAEYESKIQNKEGFIVVFVPLFNKTEDIYDEYSQVFDSESKQWRFNNIVLAATSLSKSCKGFCALSIRKKSIEFVKNKNTYPKYYDGKNLRYIDIAKFYRKLNKPNMVRGLSASVEGVRYIKKWMHVNGINGDIVVITVRESDYDKTRNNKHSEWLQFANYLKKNNYCPVIVPDTDNSFMANQIYPEILIFNECAWNMELRMALYELAYINFFLPNGPLVLCAWNSNCNYIAMNMLPEGSPVTTKESYEKIGYKIGENYKFAHNGQRLIFKDDTFKNILQEFNSFVGSQCQVNDE
jgi:hypothetical protein